MGKPADAEAKPAKHLYQIIWKFTY